MINCEEINKKNGELLMMSKSYMEYLDSESKTKSDRWDRIVETVEGKKEKMKLAS